MSHGLWQLKSIHLEGLSRPRLREVTLDVASGVTAVIGESGAGKTSLLNLLAGFERPDAGEIHFIPQSANRLPVAWVPVDGGLWPGLTVAEHLAFSAAAPSDMWNQPWLPAFDLKRLADQRVEVLSQGEKGRVAVARALVSDAAVLVMDEPLAHVDSSRRDACWRALLEYLHSHNSSLVLATHSSETVLRHANQVICLKEGTLAWQGAVRDLYEQPPTAELGRFLGPVNWFDPEDISRWLPEQAAANTVSACIRPERMQVLEADKGPFVVERAVFAGAVGEVELVNPQTEQRRTFYHRPADSSLSAGARVMLRLVACLAVMLLGGLSSGCRESAGDDQILPVKEFRYYTVPSERAMLPAPRGMTFGPDRELYVLDNAGRVLVYNASGTLVRQWWMPEYAAGKPEGVWILRDGRIAVADTHYHRVLFFDEQGTVLGSLGEQGEGPGQFIYTVSVTQDPQGYLYVAEYGGNDRVQKFTAEGEHVLTMGRAGTKPGEFQRASGVVWRDGTLYVADAINNRVQAFRDDGEFLGVIADADSAGLHYPYDIALAPDGTLYLAEYGANRVTRLSLEGELLGHYGTAGRGNGEFWTPWGIAVSPDGTVIVADTGNRRLVELEL